jgi:hypothetical protein
MAKKRISPPGSSPPSAVTAERFSRLHRLLSLLVKKPQSRESLSRRLRLDVRGFYRDLELLRASGIAITLTEGLYSLEENPKEALRRLPFPDPHLTLGDVEQLARGRTAVHRKLREQIERLVP